MVRVSEQLTTSLQTVVDAATTDSKSLITPVYNVKGYGAKGDGVTDDTAAIQSAIDLMNSGDLLFFPPGTYVVSNIVFDPPDDSRMICLGTLVSNTTGVAVRIGSLSGYRMRYNVEGLRVISTDRDWTTGRVGVQVVNTYESVLDIRRVYGFADNVQFLGTNGNGCSYNEVHMGALIDGQKSVHLMADTLGWCNENHFYGGRFQFSSSITADIAIVGCTHITVDHYSVNRLNNNRFFVPSLEGFDHPGMVAVDINGIATVVEYPRLEGAGGIVLGVNSLYCRVTPGFGVYSSVITDNGANNTIIDLFGMTIKGGDATRAPIESQNNYSNTADTFTGRSGAGVRTFGVTGNGLVYANQVVYSNAGFRWGTSDGSFVDRGLFYGTGSPEGVITARPGSLYTRSDGGAGTTLYVKESGIANTGWIAK